MKCPFCGEQESKVVDSRHSEDGVSIRRRRECMGCQRRFTTYEMVETLPIIVVKRNGSRQNFDRNKIINSMIRAFDKRKVDVNDLERIATEIYTLSLHDALPILSKARIMLLMILFRSKFCREPLRLTTMMEIGRAHV